jgi:hypothetical protein
MEQENKILGSYHHGKLEIMGGHFTILEIVLCIVAYKRTLQ